MVVSGLMIPSCNVTHFEYFYEASKDPPVEETNRRKCECYITKELYDSDRCWVTYADSKTVTTYVLNI